MDVRLIYKSAHQMKATDVKPILEQAERNNKLLNITGLLLYRYKYFFQLLEGPRENVNYVYNKIVKDDRHHECQLLFSSDIEIRIVQDMHMNLLSEKVYSKKAEQLFGPFNGLKFDSWSGQKANDFCHVIINTNSLT